MTEDSFLIFPMPQDDAGDRHQVEIIPVTVSTLESVFETLPEHAKMFEESGLTGRPVQTAVTHDEKGRLSKILVGVHDPVQIYDFAAAAQKARDNIRKDRLERYVFSLRAGELDREDINNACIGWYLGCYAFSHFKTEEPAPPCPQLLWPENADRNRVEAFLESLYVTRNLINLPANVLGPEELAFYAAKIAEKHDAEISVLSDEELCESFPLVWAVGDSSPRRPRLIDFSWGNTEHPKITLVGKGVVFDTGGLDLKPHSAMELMKKDMGGAAHALGLAILIMKLDLPVRLRVIIPAVENCVSGRAFRLGDVLRTRKGLTVENGNTDAEGRLILADCLTLASEDDPGLIVDFATLTGSARAGLGFDIPAFFCTDDAMMNELREISFMVQDPIWPLPLWSPYKKDLKGDVADLSNVGKGRGDAIHAALFLKEFIHGSPDWVHLDIYAWENTGKPGRPKGGAETSLRTLFHFIEQRFGQ